MRSHYCGDVEQSLIGEEVSVCGWVHRRRDHGGVIFIDLRDREGLLQIVFDPDRPDIFADALRVSENIRIVPIFSLTRSAFAASSCCRFAAGCVSVPRAPLTRR